MGALPSDERGYRNSLVAGRTPRRRALGGLLLLRLALLLQRLAGRRLRALGTALVLVGHRVSFPKKVWRRPYHHGEVLSSRPTLRLQPLPCLRGERNPTIRALDRHGAEPALGFELRLPDPRLRQAGIRPLLDHERDRPVGEF